MSQRWLAQDTERTAESFELYWKSLSPEEQKVRVSHVLPNLIRLTLGTNPGFPT